MWSFARCATASLEVLLGGALLWGQTACGPLPAYTIPQGWPALSPQQETWLFDALYRQSAGGLDGIQNSQLTTELDHVMANLSRALPPMGFPIHVHLLAGDVPDSFALPGGEIYITRPLISLLHNEDELAGILAHELGHAYTRQEALGIAIEMQRELGVVSFADHADFMSRYNQLVTWSARHRDGNGRSDLNADRRQFAADQAGLEIMRRAGYDPHGLADAFDRLAGTKGQTGNWLSDLLGRTSVDAKRLHGMIAGSTAVICPAVPAELSAADFQRWQAAVVAYQPPPSPSQLPALLGDDRLSPLHDSFRELLFSPNGEYLLAEDGDGVWLMSVHPLAWLFHIQEPEVEYTRFSPDSSAVVLNTFDGRVERWDIASRARTMLRQDVASDPGCVLSLPSPTGDTLACVRPDNTVQLLAVNSSAVLFERRTAGLSGLDYSADGRYLAIKTQTGGWVLDLSTVKLLHLNGAMQPLLNQSFSFVSGHQALGTADPRQVDWEQVEFPSGKVVRHLKLANVDAVAETHGSYIIFRRVRQGGTGVYDPATRKILLTARVPDLDGYDDVIAGEDKTGAILLVQTSGDEVKTIARLTLPNAPLADTVADAVSDDLRFLAVSEAHRGAVWDLSGHLPPRTLQGFDHAWLDDTHLWIQELPHEDEIEHAFGHSPVFAERNEMEIDLADGTSHESPPEPLTEHLPMGPQELKWTKRGFEIHDFRSQRLLWGREPASPTEMAVQLLPDNAATLILFLHFDSDALKRELQDPTDRRRLAGVKDAKAAFWIEVVNAQTGKPLHQLLLDPAPALRPDEAFLFGDRLYMEDGADRLLAYSLSSGKPEGVWYGDPVASSVAGRQFALRVGPRKLDLYDDGATAPRMQWGFPEDVILAHFSGDGRRLLVLTRDQMVYTFSTPGAAGVQ